MPPAPRARRVLLVEDEPGIRHVVKLHLGREGFEVVEATDGATALRLARTELFELLVLDVMLPHLDGFSVCRAVRGEGPNCDSAILMLTARDSEADKVAGLESGADDYLTKPFGVKELIARVNALMRRSGRAMKQHHNDHVVTSTGRVQLDTARRVVNIDGIAVELTRQEFDLLHRLVTRPGVVFSRAALLQHVWSDDRYVTERTVDTVISRLRKKIERNPHDPELLLTAWGVGYKFADAR